MFFPPFCKSGEGMGEAAVSAWGMALRVKLREQPHPNKIGLGGAPGTNLPHKYVGDNLQAGIFRSIITYDQLVRKPGLLSQALQLLRKITGTVIRAKSYRDRSSGSGL